METNITRIVQMPGVADPCHSDRSGSKNIRVGNSLFALRSFALVTRYLKSDGSDLLPLLFLKEQQEQFPPVALFKRATRAK